jgi:hypothetical protein
MNAQASILFALLVLRRASKGERRPFPPNCCVPISVKKPSPIHFLKPVYKQAGHISQYQELHYPYDEHLDQSCKQVFLCIGHS